MGSPHKDPVVFHFSHPNPLESTTSPSTENVTCFGCNLNVTPGKDYCYRCKTCKFSLHKECYESKMPKITNHPSHSIHNVVLIDICSNSSSSSTKLGTLSCFACGKGVTGLCYHCAECSIYCHTFCLALPLSISVTKHSHKIKLEFSPPYDFLCDLCNKPSYSYNGWLYRCGMCEFDAHVACALENLEKTETIPSDGAANIEKTTPLVDKLLPAHSRSDLSTLSYQFSDSCFSIDLEKWCPVPHDHMTRVGKHVTGTSDKGNTLMALLMAERIVCNFGETKEPFAQVNWPSYDSYNVAQQNKLNPAASFLKGGSSGDFGESSHTVATKNPNENAKSDSKRCGCSCWGKFLPFCL